MKRTPYYCDICGEEIGLGENSYMHYSYAYCEKCEQIHRKNQEAKMEEEIDYAEFEELRDDEKEEYCIKVANGDGYFDKDGHYIQTCADSEDY